jgi:hypothetical protein
MENHTKLFPESLSKNDLKDRLIKMGRQTLTKQGQKVLPGVNPNKKGAPSRDKGL